MTSRLAVRPRRDGRVGAGIGPPSTLQVEFRLRCRPPAIVEAGGHTFTLIGPVTFCEAPHWEGWGDIEAIIGL
jgi:hypothetical protein